MFCDPYSKIIDLDQTLSHRTMNRLNNLCILNMRNLHSLLILKYLPFLHNSTYFQFCAVNFHDSKFFRKLTMWCNCLFKKKIPNTLILVVYKNNYLLQFWILIIRGHPVVRVVAKPPTRGWARYEHFLNLSPFSSGFSHLSSNFP